MFIFQYEPGDAPTPSILVRSLIRDGPVDVV